MARGQNLDTALPTNSRNQRLGPLIALILSSPANQLR